MIRSKIARRRVRIGCRERVEGEMREWEMEGDGGRRRERNLAGKLG